MLGIGVDIYSIKKLSDIVNDAFVEKYFTDSERQYISSKNQAYYESLCGIFVAKEAFFKALGTGIVYSMKDVSIEHDINGKPYILCYHAIKTKLESLQYKDIHLSISHDGDNAVAFVIIE